MSNPKILFLDIETSPILANVWKLFDNDVPLNMIQKDWHILSWAAKWYGEKKMFYADQRKSKPIENDKNLLKGIWKLIDEADVIITQNGKSFDIKKLNARFIVNGMKPPSPCKHLDTLRIARKHFAFTSNKLEYLSNHLGQKHIKLKARKFPGFELWKGCLSGNKTAWKEMEEYNKKDVLALEELYNKLKAWDNSTNLEVFHDEVHEGCTRCGHHKLIKNGYSFTSVGKFARYQCPKCGAYSRSRLNLLNVDKRKSIKV